MKQGKYEMETHKSIYNNETGERIVVRPDRDGLDLVEVILYDDQDKEFNAVTFTKDQSILIAKALTEIANSIKED